MSVMCIAVIIVVQFSLDFMLLQSGQNHAVMIGQKNFQYFLSKSLAVLGIVCTFAPRKRGR